MMESVESLNIEKTGLVHKTRELTGKIERDRIFNEKA